MDHVSIINLEYHINTLEMCREYFSQLIPILKLEDAIEPFLQSVSRAPIDSCLDIIRLYLKEFQRGHLRELRNPRNLYAPALHKQLKGRLPKLERIAPSLGCLILSAPPENLVFDELVTPKQGMQLPTLTQRPPTDIAKELQAPLVFLEEFVKNYLNPWEIVAYEYLTSRMRPQLAEIDPYACFLDVRAERNYGFYSKPGNLLSAKDLALPKFFSPRKAVEEDCFLSAIRLLNELHNVYSPSETALVITMIYQYIEECIKQQLMDYEQSKLEAQRNSEHGRFELADVYQNAELLQFDADDTSVETSVKEAQITQESESHLEGSLAQSADSGPELLEPTIIQNCQAPHDSEIEGQHEMSNFSVSSTNIETAQPSEQSEPLVFGADEMTPVMIFAIILAKPKALNRTVAAAELFSLPFIVRLPAVEYAVLMLKSAGIAFSGGFEEFRHQ